MILADVTGVDKDQRCVFANSADREQVRLDYDYLILATGVQAQLFWARRVCEVLHQG